MRDTEFRVSYTMNGLASETGVFYDEAKARDALRKFSAWTRAWLQVKRPGEQWKTID